MCEGGNHRLAGKRVVFVLAGEVLGGAERSALELARDLALREGATVEILALDDRPGPARGLAAEFGVPWSSMKTPWVGNRPSKAGSLLRVSYRLRRLRPDVLISATNLPNVVCGLTWRTTGASLFAWNQCDVNGTTRFGEGLFRRALASSPLVMTAARHAREWLVERWGADSRRVHVVPSKVQLAASRDTRAAWRRRLGLREDEVVACMLAHFHEGKDHETVLRAWRVAVDSLQSSHGCPVLVLAGRDAGSEARVKALAFDLDLRKHVRFAGEVDDVSGLLGSVDFAAFSSRRECLARGVTEPMAAGLAVVGSDIAGVREAVGSPGEALLVPLGDAAAFAARVLDVAQDVDLRMRVGRANAELIASRQSGEATTRVYAGLLENALTRG